MRRLFRCFGPSAKVTTASRIRSAVLSSPFEKFHVFLFPSIANYRCSRERCSFHDNRLEALILTSGRLSAGIRNVQSPSLRVRTFVAGCRAPMPMTDAFGYGTQFRGHRPAQRTICDRLYIRSCARARIFPPLIYPDTSPSDDPNSLSTQLSKSLNCLDFEKYYRSSYSHN